MLRRFCVLLSLSSFFTVMVFADTVVLRDGASYSGRLGGPADITFSDNQGVKYIFPRADVHSLAFTASGATVTLNNGRSYSGKYLGPDPMTFAGGGIDYDFPVRDVEVLVLSALPKAPAPQDKLISFGTEIGLRTDEAIDSQTSQPGQLYPATVVTQVPDAAGAVAIPRGTPAKLVVTQIKSGGAVGTPELVLALFSIDVAGKEYRVMSSDAIEKGRGGIGANKRTLELTGGGAGLGALLGGIFGGGKGAGVGAAAGAVGGGLTQLFTRGRQVKVPVEAELYFRLDQNLVLHPQS